MIACFQRAILSNRKGRDGYSKRQQHMLTFQMGSEVATEAELNARVERILHQSESCPQTGVIEAIMEGYVLGEYRIHELGSQPKLFGVSVFARLGLADVVDHADEAFLLDFLVAFQNLHHQVPSHSELDSRRPEK